MEMILENSERWEHVDNESTVRFLFKISSRTFNNYEREEKRKKLGSLTKSFDKAEIIESFFLKQSYCVESSRG